MKQTTTGAWRVAHIGLAPHRLGFFLGMLVLIASALWWALVQWSRASGALLVAQTMPAVVVHSAVMCFGFFPLFFSGFLFTAGPRWLNVEPLSVRAVAPPLLLQATGWLLWLVGSMGVTAVAWVGVALACAGLSWMTWRFLQLVRASKAKDQIHGRTVALALVLGSISLAGFAVALVLGRFDLTRAWVFTALWGSIGVVYVVVAHRMIPFFTSSALPMLDAWRPFWVLWLMLAAMALKVLEIWLALWLPYGTVRTVWAACSGSLQLAAGVALLWLAFRWGMVQSLRNRLLAMLHIGFSWIGLAFVLSGTVQWASIFGSVASWENAALHAFTMGALGSLLVAMVTRVSCGHSGRLLHADQLAFGMFCLLQVAVVVRVLGALDGSIGAWLLAAAATLWTIVMTLWGARLCSWYGRPRVDGRPG